MAETNTLNTVFVLAPVKLEDPITGAQIDPTGYTVQLAFTAVTVKPVSGDWVAAAWRAGGPPYIAQTLVGPANGGRVLPAGNYMMWAKVFANPELPVLPCGFLKVS